MFHFIYWMWYGCYRYHLHHNHLTLNDGGILSLHLAPTLWFVSCGNVRNSSYLEFVDLVGRNFGSVHDRKRILPTTRGCGETHIAICRTQICLGVGRMQSLDFVTRYFTCRVTRNTTTNHGTLGTIFQHFSTIMVLCDNRGRMVTHSFFERSGRRISSFPTTTTTTTTLDEQITSSPFVLDFYSIFNCGTCIGTRNSSSVSGTCRGLTNCHT
mmetsp:Transcript_2586/g.3770  ORF Transcript_2586/g.3770 Transcript_2586/m.3770 type:complete len:212 (+) Transcript_2586:300-935(+)